MANSKIIITFNEDLGPSNFVRFYVNYSPDANPVYAEEIWNYQRTASNEVAIGIPTSLPGERSAINFMAAFILDFSPQIYTVSRIANTVTIGFVDPGLYFESGSSDASVDFDIINETGPLFEFINVSFSPASDACSNIRVNVATSELATNIVSPFSGSNSANPFSFDWPRNQQFNLRVRNAAGSTISRIIAMPGLLPEIPLQINPSPNGATVIVNYSYDLQLQIGYSLDGISYQESNVFSGLVEGDYTVRVRDQFGCSKSRTFHVDSLGINSPYFHLSKAMSFRFAQRIDWGDSGNYKTDENTLSHEADAKYPYCEIQQFQSSDIIRTQFKSNYSSRTAKAVKENGDEAVLPIQQMTSNIGLTDRRDARKYSLGNGKAGIYFMNGNTYDFNLGFQIGTYTLNGALPEWAVEGNYFAVAAPFGDSGTWHEVTDIFYDETRNADVLVINENYTGNDALVNVRSQFNRFNYEVYEFPIDLGDYLDQTIQIRLENSDPNFTDLVHLSEKINVKARQADTFEIRYKNQTNTDVVYATEIENILRIPYTRQNGRVDEENDTYKTDTTAKLIQSDMYEVDEFVFEPVTKEIWRKLCQALSHDTVFIDGVGYSKNSEFDTEGPLEDTNLYVLKATMIKTGNVYSSVGYEDGGYGQSSIEIPGLIQTGSNGFLRY